MLIGKDYKIESDSLNVTISQKRINRKNKSIYWVATAYFSTVKNALKYLVDLKLSESELKDLETVKKKQDEIYRLVETLQLPPEAM